jgi:beta-N-acetylhexosaminidase
MKSRRLLRGLGMAFAGVVVIAGLSAMTGTTPLATRHVAARSSQVRAEVFACAMANDREARLQSSIDDMTAEQRVGQLFMVGVQSGASADQTALVNETISTYHAGNVVLYGSDWSSSATVRSVVRPLQKLAQSANMGVQLFVSGNQEGGQWGAFQAFYGQGFSAIPSPITQAQGDPDILQEQARIWGVQLSNAGVNLDLAPVLDTVPPGTAASNDPIGYWGREYGFYPEDVTKYGVAFERGLLAAPIAVSIKHFLGRVTGNTDFTAEGIVDEQFSGLNDPYLQPYKAGIDAGADFVMMSLAVYPRVDSVAAVFSPAMINGILRDGLGFRGIVITDDVGAAAAVADRAPAQRALDFFRAGGDMILTVQPTDIAPMTQAVLQAMITDAGLAGQIDDSVRRVLETKERYGLLPKPAASDAGC